ncbi:hypothetical protein PAXRUDRAFT_20380 [Paxillus rubicundulus Ve08.2h10]|uniref:Uncharacterized protein n=1 Tax=Paxillus rubicundulus Ve08.2h10 TaxID=930991 RepID=A0A0D0D9U7_9AGAM|nr:hypothetical protein PAXRUDRAFT_20380 [Paxillus rubicundulus Ve08.2h10]
MPLKVKSASIPHQVKDHKTSWLKEDFSTELQSSCFDEGLLSNYTGDIITDCWFQDDDLPLIPNDTVLAGLTGQDGNQLYDPVARRWDLCCLPPVLHKKTAMLTNPKRYAPQEEQAELSNFLSNIMTASG